MNETTASQRLTLDLTPEAAREVERLKDLTGLTKADLFRYAFVLLRLYIKAAEEGQEFCIIEPSGRERVVQLPIVLPTNEGADNARAKT